MTFRPVRALPRLTTPGLPVYEIVNGLSFQIFTLCLLGLQEAGPMGDFLVVLGTLAFVLVFFGLIWALDRI